MKRTTRAPRKPLNPVGKRPVGLSFSPYLIDAGKRRAEQTGLSFTAYLEQLIRRDCGLPTINS